jgi:ribosomal protein S18 acetylase RimI-like enzyme
MVLKDSFKEQYKKMNINGVMKITKDNLQVVQNFYEENFKEHSFSEELLDLDYYYGIKYGEKLISLAGVHVLSKEFQVAAIGNVATKEEFRKKGYSKKVMSFLIKELLKKIDVIGLNVDKNNESAIKLYESMGFVKVTEFNDYFAKVKK